MDEPAIRRWVCSPERGRPWLAELLGVSSGTVDNWFSAGFPKRTQRMINALARLTTGLQVKLTPAEFDRIEQARAITGHDTRAEYYEAAITEFTDSILAGKRP